MTTDTTTPADLVTELRAVAAAFTADEAEAAAVLQTMAADVARALAEPITIFPVIHHSPASAVHLVRWLRANEPELVCIELCEDLRPLVDNLRDCSLPVAFEAYAGDVAGHPEAWAPLSLIAPFTELSAEYQAIAYALSTPGVALEFVDRSSDHVFQWRDPDDDPDHPVSDDDTGDDDDDDAARLHGGALGIELGGVTPSFPEFRDLLLANARMSHLSEWMSLYVEGPTIGAGTDAYREVLCMIGSLFRRLGSTPHHRDETRRRDRYMWTRIKQALARHDVAPSRAVFICGAAHIVDDDVPEWGLAGDTVWDDLPEPTATAWQHGFVPSSYGAIEQQFGHPRGAVSLAEAEWRKAVRVQKLTPFTLGGGKQPRRSRRPSPAPAAELDTRAVLRDSPGLSPADHDELLDWCTGIVATARKNRYLASTADAIAIYESAMLLAGMRARKRPSPYDFVDAAELCLEKSRVPGRRSVRQLCHRLLGGDRMGQVGYDSLPPLVRDVYDRLAPIGVSASTRRVERVLMDFGATPELLDVSRLLWRLHWLLPGTKVARPIMGELALGVEPRQESWDVRFSGPEQKAVIQLAFQGVTVEQVLEQRLHGSAFADGARTTTALEAAETCLLLLDRTRLVETLGERAVALLAAEAGADDAPAIFDRARRLVHHHRSRPDGLPGWLERFVATGYAHYATLLPTVFADRGATPDQVAAMLSFIFTLEPLALSMGCQRSQLVIAIEQSASGATDPEKAGLLWAAQWLLQLRDEDSVRHAFEEILAHPLGRSAYPRYLGGFLRALGFAPRVAPLTLDLLGRAFATLPDRVLLPWLPGLLQSLRALPPEVMPSLLGQLLPTLPPSFETLGSWDPSWMREPGQDTAGPGSRAPVGVTADAAATSGLLQAFPAATDGHADALGVDGPWSSPGDGDGRAGTAGAGPLALLGTHPATALAWAEVLAADRPRPG